MKNFKAYRIFFPKRYFSNEINLCSVNNYYYYLDIKNTTKLCFNFFNGELTQIFLKGTNKFGKFTNTVFHLF